MCDFLYLTLNTAHGRIDHHQRRRRQLSRSASFFYRVHARVCCVCALARAKIPNCRRNHKRKKPPNTFSHFYWEHLLGLFFFSSLLRLYASCAQLFYDDDMMTTNTRWRYLFIYWNFSSVCCFLDLFVCSYALTNVYLFKHHKRRSEPACEWLKNE